MYGWGWLKQNRLSCPVISIGSISAGGAGKTPVVALLAGILRRRSYEVNILTRGYGRASSLVERVEPFDDPAWHGDEPVWLAQRTGVPVFAAAERYRAGLMAEKAWPGDRIGVHLLDDGFQHLRLARNIDIVLLTLKDIEDVLLPAGNLRESLAAVSEADVVVVQEQESAQLQGVLEELQNRGKGFVVWTIRRTLSLPEEEEMLPTFPLAFCGIARPENFSQMLKSSRYEALDTVVFPDHYRYQERDMTRLLEEARRKQANGFVTTEKDAIKLTPAMRRRLEEVGPVIVARLRVELVDEKGSMAQLVSMVAELDRRKARERS
jgi:tetraacyldisaccharide 4'-kinase